MLACLRIGAVMLPCSEQLRAKDIALRLRPRPSRRWSSATSATGRRSTAPSRTARCSTLPGRRATASRPTTPSSADARSVLRAVHLGDERRAEAGDARPALRVGPAAAGRALARRRAGRAGLVDRRTRLVEVGAQRLPRAVAVRRGRAAAGPPLRSRASGSTRSARERRQRAVHGADRVPADRRARPDRRRCRRCGGWSPPARRSACPPLDAWREQTGLSIADGYGQTETGHLAGVPAGRGRAAGLDGPAAAGRARRDRRRRAVRRSGHRPDVLPRLRRRARRRRAGGTPATGCAQDDDGWLFFESRADDVIVSAGYRIGPAEVESTLLGHPAVREAAVIGVPDEARGEIVRGRRRAARRVRPRRTSWRASCRSTSRPRPRRTSTRAGSGSSTSCRRRPAARSTAPRCGRQRRRVALRSAIGDGVVVVRPDDLVGRGLRRRMARWRPRRTCRPTAASGCRWACRRSRRPRRRPMPCERGDLGQPGRLRHARRGDLEQPERRRVGDRRPAGEQRVGRGRGTRRRRRRGPWRAASAPGGRRSSRWSPIGGGRDRVAAPVALAG